nr:PREDICTED: uncharacterized protein LOC105272697 [Fopius arisanus]
MELKNTRQVFLGLCLPGTCNCTSLSSLLRASADRIEKLGNGTHHSKGPRISVVSVKPVPSSNYSILDDSKIYILGLTGGVILLLMILAIIYENQRTTRECDIESPPQGTISNDRTTYKHQNLGKDRTIPRAQGSTKEGMEKIMEGPLETQDEKLLKNNKGASDHLINRDDMFSSVIELDPPIKISIAKHGEFLSARRKGKINVTSNMGVACTIDDILYCPEIPYNLLSVRKMQRTGLSITFDEKRVEIRKNGNMVMYGKPLNSLVAVDFEVTKKHDLVSDAESVNNDANMLQNADDACGFLEVNLENDGVNDQICQREESDSCESSDGDSLSTFRHSDDEQHQENWGATEETDSDTGDDGCLVNAPLNLKEDLKNWAIRNISNADNKSEYRMD